jgi:hypothetical protein
MIKGVVLVYFGKLGGRLQQHQRVMLMKDAETIANILTYDFGGEYLADHSYDRPIFYVPDDSLLCEEASALGIQTPEQFYGGVVPFSFAKTKAIGHPLLSAQAAHPVGWSSEFAEGVSTVVLFGYTAFTPQDARIAASRLLASGRVRTKLPLGASGKGQQVVSTLAEFDQIQARWSASDLERDGIVLEENLADVRTISIGLVMLKDITVAYCGTQRTTKDNRRRPVYGGSTLICVRGGWNALERLPLTRQLRIGLRQARIYDEAMNEYKGFMASRRNYDVAQGRTDGGEWKSGVLESSWRVGGATAAELLAIRSFQKDPDLKTTRVTHIEEFGDGCIPPEGSLLHFQGEDPAAGRVTRYTVAGRLGPKPSFG